MLILLGRLVQRQQLVAPVLRRPVNGESLKSASGMKRFFVFFKNISYVIIET